MYYDGLNFRLCCWQSVPHSPVSVVAIITAALSEHCHNSCLCRSVSMHDWKGPPWGLEVNMSGPEVFIAMTDPWVKSNTPHLRRYPMRKWVRHEWKWVGLFQGRTHWELEKTCAFGSWKIWSCTTNSYLWSDNFPIESPEWGQISKMNAWENGWKPVRKKRMCVADSYARDVCVCGGGTSRLLRVLNSIRSWSLVKASLEYWKLNVENGVSGSSKMSKSAKSFSFSVSRGTPESQLNQLINNMFIYTKTKTLFITTQSDHSNYIKFMKTWTLTECPAQTSAYRTTALLKKRGTKNKFTSLKPYIAYMLYLKVQI